MTRIELVQGINKDLYELRAMAASESPVILRLVDMLIKLTDPFAADEPAPAAPAPAAVIPEPACKHEHIEQGICTQCGGVLPSLQTGEPAQQLPLAACPHSRISPYGVCLDCGTCLHTFRNGSGICNQCGEQAPVEAASSTL